MPTNDSTNTKDVLSSDEQNDKPTSADPWLVLIVEAWPQLLLDIRTAILAIVRVSERREKG